MSKPSKQAVVAALDSQVEEIRHRAVRRLPSVFEEIPIELLLRALGDESWRVRKAGIHLSLLNPPRQELLDGLTAALADPDNAGLRNAATEVLVQTGHGAVDSVVPFLFSKDQDVRKFAADILGEIGHVDALGALMQGMDDDDENVRGACAEALGHIGDPSCEERLLRAIERDGLLVRMSCLDALNRLGSQVPLATLQTLLQARPLRPQVFKMMGGLSDPVVVDQVVPELIDALLSRGRAEREAAATALLEQYRRASRRGQVEIRVSVARSASDELCGWMCDSMSSGELEKREAATAVLGWTGRLDVVDALIREAKEERLRKQVADSILAIGPRASQKLAELFDELGCSEKVLAVELLGHFKIPGSLPCIVEACLDDDSEVADTAQRALGHMGDQSVLPTLVGLIERGRLARTSGAIGSLILLGERFHDEVIRAVEPLLVVPEAGPRAAGAEVVAGVAHKEDQQLMERLAGDHEPQVRAVAIQALGRIGGGEIIDRLRLHLADENAEVRLAAARALGNRADENAIIALRVALGDSDPRVVAQALVGLGQAGSTEAGEVVSPYVEHPDPVVALAAVKALNQLGWGEDQERLRRASRHADSEVVKEVLAGCCDWPQEAARAVLSEALTHKRWDVRMTAVKKIGAMRDSAGLQMLAERLQSEEDPIVREAAEQVLKVDVEGAN